MDADHTRRVLLVEDSPVQRTMIRGMLEQIGFRLVEEAPDGYAALALLKSNTFDLIVSDWDMPKTSGYQLLLVVRNDPRHGRTPFVMATAHSNEEAMTKARRAGVSAYLAKPYKREELEVAINTAFSNKL